MLWYKLAYRQHRSLQECQRTNTSIEFLEWVQFIEIEEWQQESKQDYYLAQIATEIRNFREGFTKSPKSISPKDMLIPFVHEETQSEVKGTTPTQENSERAEILTNPDTGVTEYEVGQELVKDPKWAAVNAKAKAHWGQMLGKTIE